MKRRLTMSILVAGLLWLPPTLRATIAADPAGEPGAPASQGSRPCGTWGLSALRGTYAFSATAWQNLSEINPELPKGYAPVSIVGAFGVNGTGEVTGWAMVNAGGVSMSAELVNSQFGAPKADCSFPISLSMRIKEYGGVVTGPYAYAGVIAGDMSALEIVYMMLGAGPGSHVELSHARRISMTFD